MLAPSSSNKDMPVILPGVARRFLGYPVGMPQVQVFADVYRSADSMWRDLGSFQGIRSWHPMVTTASGDGEEPGATRTLETEDGLRWEERLVERDPAQRVYRYEATVSELPIADFHGEFRIRAGGQHRCTAIWSAHFTVTDGDEKTVSDAVRRFFRSGARAIERQYAPRPVAALRRRVRTLQRRL
ncbi:SRPBCC family protein [Mycobacterium sp. NPDC048908]|uniref:SRPBCC family protein n=1 Tax=Mycobacterium sp. NPDC048908 TaxID=3364292 RepID=UPI003717EAFE